MRPEVVAGFRAIGLLLGAALSTAPMAGHADGVLGGLVAGTTDYVFRGLSQTRGGPAIQAGVHYRMDSGWFAGIWGSTVDLNRGAGSTLELDAFAGRDWQLGEAWSARMTAVHYAYPNDTPYLRYDYDELIGSVAYRDRLVASVAWSPNTSRYSSYGVAENRTAYTFDLVGRLGLRGPFAAVGGVGYYDLEDLFGSGYTYWSAGLACTLDHLHIDVAFYGTSGTATELFGSEVAGDRWSLTAAWRF